MELEFDYSIVFSRKTHEITASQTSMREGPSSPMSRGSQERGQYMRFIEHDGSSRAETWGPSSTHINICRDREREGNRERKRERDEMINGKNLYIGTKMVVPPLPALLPNPTQQLLGNLRPFLHPMLLHQLHQQPEKIIRNIKDAG